MAESDSLSGLSTTLGWLYFFAWSISFYPQVILNFRRQSVSGLSLEFQFYNLTGFLFYSIYTCTSYGEGEDGVETNDIAFAVHALVLTIVCIIQCFIYRLPTHHLNRCHVLICSSLWLLLLYNVILSSIKILPWYTSSGSSFSLIQYLGYAKSLISFVKYVPQAYMNYRRQSTIGWSIGNVLLDLTGGLLSFAQQFIDSVNDQDWGKLSGNIPKLLLSIESVSFDVLFIVQHYVLYRHSNDEKNQPVLRDENNGIGGGGRPGAGENEAGYRVGASSSPLSRGLSGRAGNALGVPSSDPSGLNDRGEHYIYNLIDPVHSVGSLKSRSGGSAAAPIGDNGMGGTGGGSSLVAVSPIGGLDIPQQGEDESMEGNLLSNPLLLPARTSHS